MSFPQTGYFTADYRSEIDDSAQPFALWVPLTYSPLRSYPLIVALHGTDADHRMIPEQCFQMHRTGFREDVIFLSPFGRGDLFYQHAGEADIWDTIKWVKAHYRIDAQRQYLTGLSMGGFATWRLACDYPEQWAAVAPICGGHNPDSLHHLHELPVWCVHGALDQDVSVQRSRTLISALRRLKSPCRYSELRGWGHNSWEWLYDPRRTHESLVDWFLQFKKPTPPKPIHHPKPQGRFHDVFSGRVVITIPAHTSIPQETRILSAEAEKFARFQFGDLNMKVGKFLVKADREIPPQELKSSHHLMLGRPDNHTLLRLADRTLLARPRPGQLCIGGETFLRKALVAATLQPSPWNSKKFLAVVTYQQVQAMHGIAEALCAREESPLELNLLDQQFGRFILREPRPISQLRPSRRSRQSSK